MFVCVCVHMDTPMLQYYVEVRTTAGMGLTEHYTGPGD